MNTQIQRKQMVMLVLSSMLAIGSYWIPLSPGALMRNPDLSKRVALVDSGGVEDSRPQTGDGLAVPVIARGFQAITRPDNAERRPDTLNSIAIPGGSHHER